MSATYCVGEFARRIERLPAKPEAYREALAAMPESCDRDCTPGGCRAHCREYATGAWIRVNTPNKPTPKRGKR